MYKTLHRKLKIAEHEHHLNLGKNKGTADSRKRKQFQCVFNGVLFKTIDTFSFCLFVCSSWFLDYCLTSNNVIFANLSVTLLCLCQYIYSSTNNFAMFISIFYVSNRYNVMINIIVQVIHLLLYCVYLNILDNQIITKCYEGARVAQ